MLLVIFVLGLAGTGAELILLQHYEDTWQVAPLALMAAAAAALLWHAVSRRAVGIRAFQGVMALFVVSGVLGMWFHYRANAAFERELDPSLGGAALFRESLGGATPSLAPGTMIQLGLIGFVYAYRHPRLAAAEPTQSRRQAWDV
jgi:hypothetical protein